MNIEETHKENFKRIKKYGLNVGDILEHKNGAKIRINSIHHLYGWVTFDRIEGFCTFAQNLDDMKYFKKVE